MKEKIGVWFFGLFTLFLLVSGIVLIPFVLYLFFLVTLSVWNMVTISLVVKLFVVGIFVFLMLLGFITEMDMLSVLLKGFKWRI